MHIKYSVVERQYASLPVKTVKGSEEKAKTAESTYLM
jgi:hypothetical protein